MRSVHGWIATTTLLAAALAGWRFAVFADSSGPPETEKKFSSKGLATILV